MHQMHGRVSPAVCVHVPPKYARARVFLHDNGITIKRSRFACSRYSVDAGCFYMHLVKDFQSSV